MKYVLLALFCLSLIHCSAQDKGMSPYLNNLKGTWVLTSAQKDPAVKAQVVEEDGYIRSSGVSILTLLSLSSVETPTKVYVYFDSNKKNNIDNRIIATSFVQDNGVKKQIDQRSTKYIVNGPYVSIMVPGGAYTDWEMTWLKPTELTIKNDKAETLTFKKVSDQSVVSEVTPSTLGIDIKGKDENSKLKRSVTVTDKTATLQDVGFSCVQELTKFTVTVPGHDGPATTLVMDTTGWDYNLKFRLSDKIGPSMLTYSEGDSLQVEGKNCAVVLGKELRTLTFSISCSNAAVKGSAEVADITVTALCHLK